MGDNKKLNADIIADIILCEPITSKGRGSLTRLGLTTNDITPARFLNTIRVKSKYDASNDYEIKGSDDSDESQLYYKYTVDYIQFEELQNRLKRFESRLRSDSPNEYPLLILGVAGNGKSIEINKELSEVIPEESEFACGKAYIDLEEAFSELTYGVVYKCPEHRARWLFCIKILDGIMRYIRHCHELCPVILERFNNNIAKENLASEEQIQLFESIGNYRLGDSKSETAVFSALIGLLESKEAEQDIQALLKILMWVMFCSEPEKKHYIVFDNIEEYIKLNGSKIQIPDSDISRIYKAVNNAVTNTVNTFNRIERDLVWKAFKIIIVLRRTSLGLLGATHLHFAARAEQNLTDLTGYFQIPDIWQAKKKYVWPLISDKFDNSENKDIIKLVDFVMEDGVQAVGADYQSVIAPLMSYGIRRNARSQAHSIYEAYKILSDVGENTINQSQFYSLMSTASSTNSAVRYMFRRALIEFQFKWQMSNENRERWKNLGIGHLSGRRNSEYGGKIIEAEKVSYCNDQYITLMRRILAFLSHFPDRSNGAANGQNRTTADMFSTLSLYDLIEGVLVNPQGDRRIPDDDFLQIARVLIALGDMSNGDTKSAPYIILGIQDDNFHVNPSDIVFAELLKKIWKEGGSASLPGGKYHCGDYGVRLTDAGEAFLLDWQASFSFMASLYCFTTPPLFFLRDVLRIQYVIDTVYKASVDLCRKYEQEAERFCGLNIRLKGGTYLPVQGARCITFKQRVKELHINHLKLYRRFIEQNYQSLKLTGENMLELTRPTGFINRFISQYEAWKTDEADEEVLECF